MLNNEPKKIHVLAIGYGRNLFVHADAERQRMLACAHEVQSYHMIVFTHRRDQLEVANENGLTLYPTNSRSKLLMLWDAYWLGKNIVTAQQGEWVVTAQDPFEAGLVAWLIARRKRLALNLQEHADYFSTPHWRLDTRLNRVRYYLGRFLLQRADCVRVVSKRIERAIQALGVPAERIINLPVRSDQITTNTDKTKDAGSLRARYRDALIVLTMARLVSQKHLTLLIRAFAALAKEKPEALLVIVGKGQEENQLRALVQKHQLTNRVVFMPWSDNPKSLLQEADIYALTSNWEGWARVLVEAMAAGVPVVTTDVGCAGEVLLDGQHGYVVPVGDEAMFAQRLIELARDKAQRIAFGAAGKAAAAAFHTSSQAYAAAWADVLVRTVLLHKK